jgi:kumamolisin
MMRTTWVIDSFEIPHDLLLVCDQNNLSVSSINDHNLEIKGNRNDLQTAVDFLSSNTNVQHIFGLDLNDIHLHHYHQLAIPHADLQSYTPPELGELYKFPVSAGEDQIIGIIELGGGYKRSDILTYLNSLGITDTPNLTDISVDGAVNNPDDSEEGAVMEVILDVEVIISLVPRAAIRVYFAPNTGTGFYDAVLQASIDKCNMISISWGNREDLWSSSALNAFNTLFAESPAIIFCAAGDAGSSDGGDPSTQNVDFPSSSPNAIGCGGTELIGQNGQITSETVWNNDSQTEATGGGISKYFVIPSYQEKWVTYDLKGFRGVPDVCGSADPDKPYKLYAERFGGSFYVGGTSAVSPLWSALLARVQALSKNAVPKNDILAIMYAHRSAFNDVIVGNNGYFYAQQGWDPTTGNGSPNGIALLKLFADYVPPPIPVELNKPFPTWAIALIVVLAVLIILAACVASYFVHKKHSKKIM